MRIARATTTALGAGYGLAEAILVNGGRGTEGIGRRGTGRPESEKGGAGVGVYGETTEGKRRGPEWIREFVRGSRRFGHERRRESTTRRHTGD
ncbi:hypothetical protein L226DRAFT_149292 [Lentinus tigrinus ALCF2SS1-7]|uniref:Uncharacterized protein n=1 Tax=Lentinus tigrinus ALCF2SS1-6 TaxID=1328759 RepID=A0A5C2RV23_9APHY|nr:hypothetical protein L227DRAFT_301988 [Lentinus tigrinus ALCF2SS1-6]RPD72539.1 hypothetical protein L226DRAFT_149292 [Lentinus tigrinus ALCF2SS1-7]